MFSSMAGPYSTDIYEYYKDDLNLIEVAAYNTDPAFGFFYNLKYYKKDNIECGQPHLSVIDFSNNKSSFSVHPNPASSGVTIELQTAKPLPFQIVDLTGRCVKSGTTKSGISIPISELAEGLYLVKITDGKSAQVQKLVIQH